MFSVVGDSIAISEGLEKSPVICCTIKLICDVKNYKECRVSLNWFCPATGRHLIYWLWYSCINS